MSPARAAAAAIARGASVALPAPSRTRTRVRPAPQRRRSGAAQPRTTTRVLPRYDFVGVLDRLLRGPVYIALVGILLAGIVFFNVGVLELNHGIASTDIRAAQLKRQNAALTLQLAKLGSSERIQRVALSQGLVLPQPGDVRYLRVHSQDAAHALRVMTAPDPTGAGAVTPAPTFVTQQSQPQPGISATPTTTAPTTTTTAPPAGTTTQPTSTAPPTAQSTTTTQPAPTTQQQTTPAPATTAPATTTQGGATQAPAATTP